MLVERESIRRTWVHKALIALGFLMLFWPAATTNLFGDGLAGYQPSSPAPRASLSDWFDRSFQIAANQWWRERFGMRFFFVKLDNQLDYWLFDRIYEGEFSLVYGDDKWIYNLGGVQGYCMLRAPSDEEAVRNLLAGVRRLQDALDAHGIPFVFLLSPVKASVYPDPIPDQYCTPHGSAGYDYDVYRPLFDEYGIRMVDGYALTNAAKPEWPNVTLFAQGGAHWNNLGAYYTASALLETLRPLVPKPIPPLVLGEVSIDNDPNGHDRDLVDFQNLLFPNTDYPVPHPEITMQRSPEGGLTVSLVGMSYLEQIADIYAESGGFDRVDHYWYYHHSVRDYVTDDSKPLTRETIDWAGGLLAADAVVLDMTMLYFYTEHVAQFVEDGLAHLDGEPPTR